MSNRLEDNKSPYDSMTFGNPLSLRVDGAIGAMSVSPCGRDAVLAGRRGLFVIDLDDPHAIPRWLHHTTSWEVADVQWSPHPSKPSWVVSTSNQKAMVWNLARSSHNAIEHFLHWHTRAITDINFHPDHPEILATCSVDTSILSWDMRTPKKPVHEWAEFSASATQVKWNYMDPNILASSHDNYFYVWDVRKGAIPITKIVAHSARVNGIDWSRNSASKIISCSNDETVKFWDYNKDMNEPQYTIRTNFPVNRARHVPFGDYCCGIMPLRGGDNSIYIVDYKDQKGESPLIPVHTFKGHSGPVKEFLWRSRHTLNTSVDDREFQLVTWSKDCDLRLWPVDDSIYRKLNYVRNKPLPDGKKLIDFEFKTYGNEPIDPNIKISGDAFAINKRRTNSSDIGAANPYSLQFNHINWISGVRMGESAFANTIDDPNSFEFGNSTGNTQLANLGEEVSNVGHKFPKLRFERISVSTGKLVISLNGPWSSVNKDELIFLRVEANFPKEYPSKDAIPRFTLEKTRELTDEVYDELTSKLNEIATFYCSRKEFCFEQCLRYLLGEKIDLEKIGAEEEELNNDDANGEEDNTFFQDSEDDEEGEEEESGDYSQEFGENGDKKKKIRNRRKRNITYDDDDDEDVVVIGVEEASEKSDGDSNASDQIDANEDKPKNVINRVPGFDSTPIPKGCGAVWTPSGHLVCFFIPKEEKRDQTIRFGKQGFSLASKKKKKNGSEFGRDGISNSAYSEDGGESRKSKSFMGDNDTTNGRSNNNNGDDSDSDDENSNDHDDDNDYDDDEDSTDDNYDIGDSDSDDMFPNNLGISQYNKSAYRMPSGFMSAFGTRQDFFGKRAFGGGGTGSGAGGGILGGGGGGTLNDTGGSGLGATTEKSHGTVLSRGVDKPNKNLVKIYDFQHLIPSKMELALEYRLLGDLPSELAKHNAQVAQKYQYWEISDCWKILGVLLVKDVTTDDGFDNEEIKLLMQSDLGNKLFASNKAQVVPGKNFRFYWGMHPFGFRWLAKEIINYYIKLNNIQMVAMLSCILHEHARNKNKPTIPIQTPYDLSELHYSRSGSVISSTLMRNSVSFDKHRSSVLSIDSNSTVNSTIQPASYIPHSASFGNSHTGNSLVNANTGSPSANGITIPSKFVNSTGLPNRISSVATIGSYEGSFKSASPERSNNYFSRNIRQQSFSYTPDNFNFSSPVQMPSTHIGLSINNSINHNNNIAGLGTSNGSVGNGPSGFINSGNGSGMNHSQLYNSHHQHHPSVSSISSKRQNVGSLSAGYFNVGTGNGMSVSNKVGPMTSNGNNGNGTVSVSGFNTAGNNSNNNNSNNGNITTSRIPKVNITMMNVETLDLYDDVYCMPLLDDLDKQKLNVIRSEYASLLYYWGLPVNRVKVLKFNYSDKVNTDGYEFNDNTNGGGGNGVDSNAILTNFRSSFKINGFESDGERSGRGSNARRSVNSNGDNYGGPFRDQLVEIGWCELSIPEVVKSNRQVSGDYFGATSGEFSLKLPPGKGRNSSEVAVSTPSPPAITTTATVATTKGIDPKHGRMGEGSTKAKFEWNKVMKKCQYCDLQVKRRIVVCTYCNHIQHASCAMSWWEQMKQTECPSGCGCQCLKHKLREFDEDNFLELGYF